jgi:BirA family transcriptional regulator, biotin operon repressor / biotin---[acetyl-CoA-carboxylase] ligase
VKPGATEMWRLSIHQTLPSTSDLCRERAEAGEAEGLAVLAIRQEAGRASHGRGWSSPEGNLYLSVLLRPDVKLHQAAQWSLLAGVALAETVASLLPQAAPLSLKWPNDLLLGGRKIAGILLDSAGDTEGRLSWLVIGMGLNLASAPDVPGRETACLAELIAPPAPQQVAPILLNHLARWHATALAHGLGPVREAWLARSQRLGAPMTLRAAGGDIDGTFAGLAEDGSLLLRREGRVNAYVAGEVRLQVGR